MTDDQRHAAHRPDVITFETDVLTEDVTLASLCLVGMNAPSRYNDRKAK